MPHYPSLHQESRYEPAGVIPLKRERSLLDWLIAEGRIIARPVEEKETKIIEEEESSDLLYLDDRIYDDGDDDLDDFDTLDTTDDED